MASDERKPRVALVTGASRGIGRGIAPDKGGVGSRGPGRARDHQEQPHEPSGNNRHDDADGSSHDRHDASTVGRRAALVPAGKVVG